MSSALRRPTDRGPSQWQLELLLISPWLCSYAAAPTPTVWPWLFSAFCAIVLWILRRSLTVHLIATSWVLAATISAAFGLVQYFGLSDAFGPWLRDADAGEAFANLKQRNHFATLTSIGFIGLVALVSFFDQPVKEPVANKTPWWATAGALLLAAGNAVSSSRTGLLQWLLVLALVAWWTRASPNRRHLLVFVSRAMLFYVVALLVFPWLLTALTGFAAGGLFARLTDAPTCQSRTVLWSNVLSLIVQKPWLGWGWGELAYPHFITSYPDARFCGILDNAHNLPLHLAVELGIPTALIVCTSLGWLVWRAKPWNETDVGRQMAWAVLGVITLHSMLEYPLWYGPFQIAVGLCISLLWITSQKKASLFTSTAQIFSDKFRRTWFLTAISSTQMGLVIIAALVMIGVDYDRVSNIYLLSLKESIAFHKDPEEKLSSLSLFRNQVRFAKLGVTELTPANAADIYVLASGLLHYSPEPRVIERTIESAMLLDRHDEVFLYLARYQIAFPEDHHRWVNEHSAPIIRKH